MAARNPRGRYKPAGQVFRMANDRVDLAAFREAWGELTDHQQRIIELSCAGDSRDEIAGKLFISPHTVKSGVGRALEKIRPTLHNVNKTSGVLDVVCWAHGYQAALYALQERISKR